MAIAYKIEAESRQDEGKGASRRLRHEGKVPAVVYGGGADPQSIQLEHRYMLRVMDEEAFYTHILDLKVGSDKSQKVVVRDLQRHPHKLQVMHVDFLRIDPKNALTLNVPLHFINEEKSPAGKSAGVVINHMLTDVQISCLPKDLPEYIEVDLKELEEGQTVHMSDLVLPEGVELPELAHGTDHDQAVATAAKVRGPSAKTEEEESEESDESEETSE